MAIRRRERLVGALRGMLDKEEERDGREGQGRT